MDTTVVKKKLKVGTASLYRCVAENNPGFLLKPVCYCKFSVHFHETALARTSHKTSTREFLRLF
jgi:hypothetical protein